MFACACLPANTARPYGLSGRVERFSNMILHHAEQNTFAGPVFGHPQKLNCKPELLNCKPKHAAYTKSFSQ